MPPHVANPVSVQNSVQTDCEHNRGAAHRAPHEPQLAGSTLMSTQAPSHSVSLAAQIVAPLSVDASVRPASVGSTLLPVAVPTGVASTTSAS
jgi:predicted N-acetyltransferase YhbS